MFRPPPGYPDLCADATGRMRDDFLPLTVDEVGTLQVRRTCPASLAELSLVVSPLQDSQDHLQNLIHFLVHHLGDGELDRLFFDMMMDAVPTDTVQRVFQAVVTHDTARPYHAVMSLAATTGYHWRTLRHKLLLAGVTDPMGLPSMHILLDHTEAVVVESLANGENAQQELNAFYRRLYGPVDADDIPAGFSPDEVEDSFDAFARAAR